MKISVIALVMAACAGGCGALPCRDGTLYLPLSFVGAASAADAVAVDVTVGGQHQRYVTARRPGGARDEIEVVFRSYPRGQEVVVEVAALVAGQTVGTGGARALLGASCTALPVTLAALGVDAGPPNGGGGAGGNGGGAAGGSGTAGGGSAGDGDDGDLGGVSVDSLDMAHPIDLSPPAPPTVGFTGLTDTAEHPTPGAGSVGFVDACPSGQALVGFDIFVATDAGSNQLGNNQFAGVCGVPTVAAAPGGGWAVHVLPGATLPGRGGPTTTLKVAYRCGSDRFIVGFGGRAGTWVDQIAFSCAAMTIDANRALSLLPALTGSSVGGSGGSAFGPVSCPAGQVATVMRSSSVNGTQPVDGFGLSCSLPVSR